mmetsp:Transcript_19107/g.24585  ORF Transcript_19107/g.24585 Transcript_19107/m.24585 type:complete len:384 (-) Transcript_19107:279-1430(-)|eukprot:CAMPEP_0198146114 /NCGR_PEP_ID=MMETSP1443-20131203/27507_1 /TAXON_ID=186043 /ORGANISM="Entomoneis sp., Strain CCMP2396" /LENGTH=383 /DNA_ID=CAMNT_0043809955 /DNA_START=270 /DNA_END=1421 /DNA_ORIENTATION=+
MGASCSSCQSLEPQDAAKNRKEASRQESPDPAVYDLMRRSVAFSEPNAQQQQQQQQRNGEEESNAGQGNLLYKNQKKERLSLVLPATGQATYLPPTRLLVRRHSLKSHEEGLSGTHIYAVRYPSDQPMLLQKEMAPQQEQAPQQQQQRLKRNYVREDAYKIPPVRDGEPVDHLFRSAAMSPPPKQQVIDWVTVSEEHSIFVADVGLTAPQCDRIIQVTEHECRGQYAAYTYAKQTLGCREFPTLAAICQPVIHTMTNFILEFSQNRRLCLDDREPHMVKYDVTKKERQKLDMHTDKSEWTYLISLSNGCGVDFEGGGTYFECLDATLHIQRGHALVFPGKLRHCGQRITSGLRFLLVAFLVDKSGAVKVKQEDGPVSYHVNVP